MTSKSVLITLAAVLAVIVAVIFGADSDNVRKDGYARMCVEIVRDSALNPTTMQVVRLKASIKALTVDESLSIIRSQSYSEDLEAQIVEMVRRGYDNGLENSVVSIFADYSAENRLGGVNRDVAVCDVLEDATFTKKSRLVTILLGSNKFNSDQLNDFFLTRHTPDRLDALYQLDRITIWDRIQYIVDPTGIEL